MNGQSNAILALKLGIIEQRPKLDGESVNFGLKTSHVTLLWRCHYVTFPGNYEKDF